MRSYSSLRRSFLDLVLGLGVGSLAVLAAAVFVTAVSPGPAPAQAEACVALECPCWDYLPAVKTKTGPSQPILCYDSPGPQTNSFAYFSKTDSKAFSGPLFVQVTDFWCRANAAFKWVDAEQRDACQWDILDVCGLDDGIPCF